MAPSDKSDDLTIDPSLSEMVTTPLSVTSLESTQRIAGPIDAVFASLGNRYEMLTELGRGGMGIVYRARDRETNDLVALKVVNPQIAGDTAVLERFKSEMLLARKITHKNVCRMYELLRFGDVTVIAMEYVEGETLRAILDRSQGVSLSSGLAWASQICSALAEAHSQGVVHRDLKPENIVIDRQGQIKVMDFGLARSLDADVSATQSVAGTPAYISPEQVEGKPPDVRSDIYSLGLMLYEMFSGKRAFTADSALSLLHKHVHEPAPEIRTLNAYIPEFLQRAIHKCIEKIPASRFQSIQELELALEDVAPVHTVGGAEIEVPAYLSVWTKLDWVLLVCAIAGLAYFLTFRETVFPASSMKLEVDAITARIEAERVAKLFDRELDPEATPERGYTDGSYLGQLLSEFFLRLDSKSGRLDRKSGSLSLNHLDFPYYWKFSLQNHTTRDSGFVLSNRKGKVGEFVSTYPEALSRWSTYIPPPVEKRREIATKATEQLCGSAPEGLSMIETSGGEWAGTYTVLWKAKNAPHPLAWAEVVLTQEKVSKIKCFEQSVRQVEPELASVLLPIHKFWSEGARILLLLLFFIFFVRSGLNLSNLTKDLWGRVSFALALGLIFPWVVTAGMASDSRPEAAALVMTGIVASGVLLVLLFLVEQSLRKLAPGKLACYLQLSQGKFMPAASGFSILRGVTFGLLLLTLELGIQHSTMAGLELGLKNRAGLFFGGLPDPDAVGDASISFSPALFVLSSALFQSVLLGFIFPGLSWYDFHGSKKKRLTEAQKKMRFPLTAGGATALAVLAFNLHFAREMIPALGIVVVPALLGICLGLIFQHFDALTTMMTVFTYSIWSLSYPLLTIFSDVGNGQIWAVFAVWLGIVLAGGFIAFRLKITDAFHDLRAQAS